MTLIEIERDHLCINLIFHVFDQNSQDRSHSVTHTEECPGDGAICETISESLVQLPMQAMKAELAKEAAAKEASAKSVLTGVKVLGEGENEGKGSKRYRVSRCLHEHRYSVA